MSVQQYSARQILHLECKDHVTLHPAADRGSQGNQGDQQHRYSGQHLGKGHVKVKQRRRQENLAGGSACDQKSLSSAKVSAPSKMMNKSTVIVDKWPY